MSTPSRLTGTPASPVSIAANFAENNCIGKLMNSTSVSGQGTMKYRNAYGNATAFAASTPQKYSIRPPSTTRNDTCGRNSTTANSPAGYSSSPNATTARPQRQGLEAASTRWRLFQTRYAAMSGIRNPCEALSLVHHVVTVSASTGAYRASRHAARINPPDMPLRLSDACRGHDPVSLGGNSPAPFPAVLR